MTECTLEASHIENNKVNARRRMEMSASCNAATTCSWYTFMASRKSAIAARALSVLRAK